MSQPLEAMGGDHTSNIEIIKSTITTTFKEKFWYTKETANKRNLIYYNEVIIPKLEIKMISLP
jgi:hypothetical protein